jgi:hypothetical protein
MGDMVVSHVIWLFCLLLAAWFCIAGLVRLMQRFNDDPEEYSLGVLAFRATLLFCAAVFFAGWSCVETTRTYEDFHRLTDPPVTAAVTPAPLTKPIPRPSPSPVPVAVKVQGKETPVGYLIRQAAGASSLRKRVLLFGLQKLLQTNSATPRSR